MLIIIGVVLVAGLVFGYFVAHSGHHRQVDTARTADAKSIRDGLKPRIERLQEAALTINELKLDRVDFEAADALAAVELGATGNLLGGSRLLLGPDLVTGITSYVSDSTMLTKMLAQHKQLTNEDRAEIEQLVSGNEALERDMFAVVFDYRDMIRRGGEDNYSPKRGRLVTIKSLDRDEEGKVEFQFLNSDKGDKTEMQGFIPLQKGDIIKSAGDNALQRYEKRVRDIKIQSNMLVTYAPQLLDRLSKLADREPASFLTLTAD